MKSDYLEILKYTSTVLKESFSDNLTEMLKEIPGISTVITTIDFAVDTQQKIFVKKLNNFLHSLKDIPETKRMDMIQKIDNDKKYKHKVAEKLIEILTRVDSEVKPELLGNLFASYIREKISYEKFLRLAFVVEKSYNQDLIKLKESNASSGEIKILEGEYFSGDLMEKGIGNWDGEESEYNGNLTPIGIEILKYGWGKHTN